MQHNVKPNPDINEVSSCIEIAATEHTEALKSIYDLVDEYKLGRINGSRMSDENLVTLEFKYLQNKKW